MKDTFGARVRDRRRKAGLTLEQLAMKISSTKSHVWELENKPNIRPSAKLAYNLSVALGTTVDVLLGNAELGSLEEKERVFFRNYGQLKPQTRRRLSRIMDALMEEDRENVPG